MSDIKPAIAIDLIKAIYQVELADIAKSIGRNYHYITRLRSKDKIDDPVLNLLLDRYPRARDHIDLITSGEAKNLDDKIDEIILILSQHKNRK